MPYSKQKVKKLATLKRIIGTGKKLWSTRSFTKHGYILQLIPVLEFVKPAQACYNIMKIKLQIKSL
jgi:hypothetical protein